MPRIIQGMWYLYDMVHSVEVHWVSVHARMRAPTLSSAPSYHRYAHIKLTHTCLAVAHTYTYTHACTIELTVFPPLCGTAHTHTYTCTYACAIELTVFPSLRGTARTARFPSWILLGRGIEALQWRHYMPVHGSARQ